MDSAIITSQKELETGFSPGISKKQAYVTFAIVSLALIMSQIDSTIVTVGLPAIQNDLKTSLANVGWILTGYQFSFCIVLPIIGKISDDWGQKRVFLLAVVIFTLSSIAAGFAPDIYWLIVFRVIQGIGGGAFLPSASGIISDAFGKKRAVAIGLFTSIFSIGAVIGPNIGGFLIDQFSWRWIFFVNIPIGVLLVLSGLLILPKTGPVPSKRQLDILGAALFSGTILSIAYGITAWANSPGGAGPITWILFAAGIILLVFFIRHEDRVKEPMIDLTLLRRRSFAAANIYNFIYGAVVFGFISFVPYYATLAYGMTATESGLVLTPRSIAVIIASILTSLFILRLRYRKPMIFGLVSISAGLLLLSQGYHNVAIFGLSIPNLLLLTLIILVAGVGMGVANPASNNAILDLLPDKVAAITGMRGMFRVMGAVMSTSTIVLILSHYQDKGIGFQHIALFFAILLLLTIPLVFMIPDSTHRS
jgi:EmrB/QacA subfamily drug resistance transporter